MPKRGKTQDVKKRSSILPQATKTVQVKRLDLVNQVVTRQIQERKGLKTSG